jgi:hypothetical protein
MNFDDQGHLVVSPAELYERAVTDPHRLLNAYLMGGTPIVFDQFEQYCDFLEAVSDRTGVHTKNLYVRGSCHLGFSIAPRSDKVWQAYGLPSESDLDLVIVDSDYFHRCEEELRRWESRNPVGPRDEGAKAAAGRASDRRFNCVRDRSFPNVVCVHHRKMMGKVARMAHCGHVRDVSAFIFPNWNSAQERYEFDLSKLRAGVEEGWLPPPSNDPIPR